MPAKSLSPPAKCGASRDDEEGVAADASAWRNNASAASEIPPLWSWAVTLSFAEEAADMVMVAAETEGGMLTTDHLHLVASRAPTTPGPPTDE